MTEAANVGWRMNEKGRPVCLACGGVLADVNRGGGIWLRLSHAARCLDGVRRDDGQTAELVFGFCQGCSGKPCGKPIRMNDAGQRQIEAALGRAFPRLRWAERPGGLPRHFVTEGSTLKCPHCGNELATVTPTAPHPLRIVGPDWRAVFPEYWFRLTCRACRKVTRTAWLRLVPWLAAHGVESAHLVVMELAERHNREAGLRPPSEEERAYWLRIGEEAPRRPGAPK